MSTPFQATSVKLFQPTQISGCQLWLDAADSRSVLTNVNGVYQWNDKSGQGQNALQTVAGKYPSYTQTINGNRVVTMSSAGTTMYVTNFTVTQPPTVFVVWQKYATGGLNGFFIEQGADVNSNPGFYINSVNWDAFSVRSASAQQQFYDTDLPTGSGGVNNSFNTTGTTFMYVGQVSPNLWRLNGSSRNTTTTINTGSPSGSIIAQLNINSRNQSSLYGDIYYCEFIIYNQNISLSNIQQIEGYLAWKWGLQGSLPATHPYKNTPVYASPPFPLTPYVPYSTNNIVFTPTQISGCQLWLDAADPTTLSFNNTTITQWRDKSGKGYSGNITSGANGPTYNSTSSAVQFRSASSQSLTLSQAFGNSLVNTTLSIFVVGARRVLGVDYFLATGNANTGEGPNAGFLNDAMDIDIYGILLNSPSYYFTAPIPAYAGASEPTRIYGYNINTSFYDLVMNGTVLGTLNTSIRPTVLTNPQLGSRYAPGVNTAYHSNDINEMLVYVTSLSTAQRQNVEGYLAWKWGLVASLPDGHPYKTPPLAPFSYGVRKVQQNKWLPTQVSGCQLWLDAADISTITLSGGNISGITDKSGTNKSLTVTNTVGYISRTAIVFTDNAGRLAVASMPTSPYDYVMVCTGNSSISGFRTMLRTANTPGTHPYLIEAGTNNVGMYDGFNVSLFSSITQAANEKALFYGSMGANRTIQISKNGTVSLSPPSNAGNESIIAWIGNSSTGGQPFGQLQELVIYSGTLSLTQRQQVEGYLAWKWGLVASLPANHPYKLFPPSP